MISNMIDTLMFMLINSMFINGLKLAMEEGMILSRLGKWGEKWLGYLWQPLGGCVTCMASVYSIPYWLTFDWNLPMLIMYIPSLAALNTIIYNRYFAHD